MNPKLAGQSMEFKNARIKLKLRPDVVVAAAFSACLGIIDRLYAIKAWHAQLIIFVGEIKEFYWVPGAFLHRIWLWNFLDIHAVQGVVTLITAQEDLAAASVRLRERNLNHSNPAAR